MESFEKKKNLEFKTETIRTPEGNEVSFSPDRGGIITSLKLEGEEILYFDSETFKNTETNVKGGIPILFPNAGPIPDEIKTEELKNLKQHGFARDSRFTAEKIRNGFKETLTSNEETKKVYPYDFNFELEGIFEDDGSFTITQTVENMEKDNEMPISSGLHPYFKVPSTEKKNIKFNFEGGKEIEEKVEIWTNGKAVSVTNPNTPIEIYIPKLGTLVITASKEYKRIWGWSQEGKDFVCVEPVMNDKGGIITNPEKIKPNEKHISKVNLLLKKEI